MTEDETTDIHGTNHSKLPRIVSVERMPQANPPAVAIQLNFYPSDEQMQTLWEHLLSWHP